MSDSILKQQEIAARFGQLIVEINNIKRFLRQQQLEEQSGNAEAAQDGQRFLNPYVFFSCEVSSVVDSTTVLGFQTIPSTTTSTPWAIDPTFSNSPVTLTVPANVSAPSVGDQVLAHFTGTYTNPSSELVARYGIVCAGGGAAVSQTQIQSVGDDHLVVRTLVGSTLGSTDILVAKPFKTRRTPFDGNTVNGYTYVYSTAVDRVVTIAASTQYKEVQTVIPKYNVDDVLYIQQADATLFNVTVSGTPQAVTYLDLNNDCREFVRVGAGT